MWEKPDDSNPNLESRHLPVWCLFPCSRSSRPEVFSEISQNSQENTCCARVSFLIKLQASDLQLYSLLKKRLWHRYFPVNFAKFLRTPFLKQHLWWLLLMQNIMICWLLQEIFVIEELYNLVGWAHFWAVTRALNFT